MNTQVYKLKPRKPVATKFVFGFEIISIIVAYSSGLLFNIGYMIGIFNILYSIPCYSVILIVLIVFFSHDWFTDCTITISEDGILHYEEVPVFDMFRTVHCDVTNISDIKISGSKIIILGDIIETNVKGKVKAHKSMEIQGYSPDCHKELVDAINSLVNTNK